MFLKMQAVTITPATLWHLIVITSTMVIMRLSVRFLPLARYRNRLGQHLGICNYCPIVDVTQLAKAKNYGDLTDRVSRRLPLSGDCLVSALTFAAHAKRAKIPYVLHLGASLANQTQQSDGANAPPSPPITRPASELATHAWVVVGNTTVAGAGEDLDQFQIIASFCNPSLPPIPNTQAG